ncbi:hypothetical protein D9M70_627840 [compost metagenome]
MSHCPRNGLVRRKTVGAANTLWPSGTRLVITRETETGRGEDGQTLFQLCDDERGQEHDAVAGLLQLPGARHACGDADRCA